MKVNNIHSSSQTILLDLLGVTYYVIDSLIVGVFNMKTRNIEGGKLFRFLGVEANLKVGGGGCSRTLWLLYEYDIFKFLKLLKDSFIHVI